ncbi:hypothetical protein KR222_001149, partial [Zaprionus bogoriensis]
SQLNSDIFPAGGPEPTALVELSGPPKSGKTLLLMQLVAQCLTRCDVVLLNASHKIDAPLLGQLVSAAVRSTHEHATPAELQQLCEKSMNSLEVYNCYCSQDMELTLKALEQFLLLENERISLIAVDALCEFYWLDEPQRKYTYYMNWLARLKKICNRFYVCCIYTVDSSFHRKQY